MAPSTLTDRSSPTVVPAHSAAPVRASRLPKHVRLFLLFVLNLGLHSALLTATNNFLGSNELGAVTKKPVDDGDDMANLVSALGPRLGYKMLVVWLGWQLNYDFLDISALTVLTTMPFAYLLMTYYAITPATVGALVANEVIAIALPTYLLRSRSAVNNHRIPVRNRYLLQSSQVQISNTLLAVGVYVVVMYSGITTGWLTEFLITNASIPTVEGVHAETPITMISKLLLAGFATKNFILNPSIGATATSGDVTPVEEFDPATADLPKTFKHNFWNFSRRTRTLIQQTTVASIFMAANTMVRTLSLEGSTVLGAAGYSGVWVLANIICGAWFVWVSDADSD